MLQFWLVNPKIEHNQCNSCDEEKPPCSPPRLGTLYRHGNSLHTVAKNSVNTQATSGGVWRQNSNWTVEDVDRIGGAKNRYSVGSVRRWMQVQSICVKFRDIDSVGTKHNLGRLCFASDKSQNKEQRQQATRANKQRLHNLYFDKVEMWWRGLTLENCTCNHNEVPCVSIRAKSQRGCFANNSAKNWASSRLFTTISQARPSKWKLLGTPPKILFSCGQR